jgi:hypothetical protein
MGEGGGGGKDAYCSASAAAGVRLTGLGRKPGNTALPDGARFV